MTDKKHTFPAYLEEQEIYENLRPYHNHPMPFLPHVARELVGAELDAYVAQFAHLLPRAEGEDDTAFKARLR